MNLAMAAAIFDEIIADRRYDLLRQEIEVARRQAGDQLIVSASRFPTPATPTPDSRRLSLTIADLHRSHIVRDPGQGLRGFVAEVFREVVESLVEEREPVLPMQAVRTEPDPEPVEEPDE